MVDELLAPSRIAAQGIFNPIPVSREVAQHMTGKYDRRFTLFDLVMFQLWLDSLALVPRSVSSEPTILFREARHTGAGARSTTAPSDTRVGRAFFAAD